MIREFKYGNRPWVTIVDYDKKELRYSDKATNPIPVPDPDKECQHLLALGYVEVVPTLSPNHYGWIVPNLNKKACLHEYKTYTGLRETYEYCTVCNEKKA